jgi:transcriptional regulator GlxA family with amidase domain
LTQRRSTKVRERRKSGRRRPGIFRRQTLSLLLLPRFSSSPFFSLCILLLTSATKYPRSLSIWKHVLRTRKAREAGSIFESADDAGLNEEREALLSAVLARSFSRS